METLPHLKAKLLESHQNVYYSVLFHVHTPEMMTALHRKSSDDSWRIQNHLAAFEKKCGLGKEKHNVVVTIPINLFT